MILLFVFESVSAIDFLTLNLRGRGGNALNVEGDLNFVIERSDFSAWVTRSTKTANSGEGYLYVQGRNGRGDNERYSVQFVNSVIVAEAGEFLQVKSEGYRYIRINSIFGIPILKKISGKVTYTYNAINGRTNVIGTEGLDF